MDTSFSAEDLAFRDEVREFFATEWNDDIIKGLKNPETFREAMTAWHQTLYKKGWAAPNWPEEYGGPGWTSTQKYIFDYERAAAGAQGLMPFGLSMVGPVIFTFGTEEQKKRFLPVILDGTEWWCQGYSEPGAGSDLASLKTKAERDGDHYIVNGAKIWTSYAHQSDWIFCLVRTSTEGKKQEGISFLLIDMKSEGIKVNPIITIDGGHTLNETEFNNVRVPVENLIGEENKGWTYAKSLLAHERTGIASVSDSKRNLEQVKELASAEVSGGRRMIDDPGFQTRLSDIEVELMGLEFTELRVLASVATGGAPGPESSLLKIKGTEVQQRIQELRMDLAGYYQGVYVPPGGEDPSGHEFGDFSRYRYMYGRAATIYGGSNEIQKNIIAKAVLGLG
jgi:alkylation response protein AidB-like acyl-CoA dehydrogenase